MKTWIINLAINRPRLVYVLVTLVVLACASQLPQIRIDTDPENMLSASDPARSYHAQIKRQFSLYDAIVVGVVAQRDTGIYTRDNLAVLHQLTADILGIEQVITGEVMALSQVDNITQQTQLTQHGAPGTGGIRFEWLMKQPPASSREVDAIKQAVERLPMLANTLVSGDGKAAAIYVPLSAKEHSYQVAEQIRALYAPLATSNPELEFHITGLPVAEDQFGAEMFIQMAISAPMAGLMIFVMMWLLFRQLSLITAPMLVAMATVLITMGLLIGLGFKVHILSSMIAIFLMPIAVVDSIHILSEFADRYRPGQNVKHTIRDVITNLFQPMLFTSITSSIGFFSLLLTPIPPVQIFGAFVGFGILLAFVLTITLVPAYVVRMSPAALTSLQQRHHHQPTRLGRFLADLGQFAVQRRLVIIVAALGISALSAWGISQITINDNPVRWFKEDHQIRIADRTLNQHFAGTYNAYLVLSRPAETNNDALAQQLLDIKAQGQQLAESRGIQLPTLAPLNTQQATETLALWQQQLDELLFDSNDAQLAVIEVLFDQLNTLASQQQYFIQPQALNYLDNLQQFLNNSSAVGKSNSLVDIVKTVNRELYGGEDHYFDLPDSQAAAAQILLQYQSSHRPNDLWHFVTPDYQQSLLWLQLSSGDNQSVSAVIEQVDSYIQANPLPEGVELRWAGKAYLNVIWQQQMVQGMLDSLLSAFVLVFVMMVILFRSLLFGVLAMLPLTLTITLIYGLIGWLGKDYDMPIAVLSSLTLGLSVDFAIHFIERFRALLRQTASVNRSLSLLFDEPARAISRNAIVIALGFTPLLLAPLVPYVTVGVFLASIMAVSALVTLLLLPALLKTINPKFVSADHAKEATCQSN